MKHLRRLCNKNGKCDITGCDYKGIFFTQILKADGKVGITLCPIHAEALGYMLSKSYEVKI